MPTPKSKRNKRSRSSCPDGDAAGYSAHSPHGETATLHRAIGITRRLQPLRRHSPLLPNQPSAMASWQDLYKAFNACREDYPFVTAVGRVKAPSWTSAPPSRIGATLIIKPAHHVSKPYRQALSAPPPAWPRSSTTASGASGCGLGSVKLRQLPKGLVYEAQFAERAVEAISQLLGSAQGVTRAG